MEKMILNVKRQFLAEILTEYFLECFQVRDVSPEQLSPINEYDSLRSKTIPVVHALMSKPEYLVPFIQSTSVLCRKVEAEYERAVKGEILNY